MSKQDRQGVRTPADLERKYNFWEGRSLGRGIFILSCMCGCNEFVLFQFR